MQVVAERFAARWKQGRIPLQLVAAVPRTRIPATVRSDNVVAKLIQSEIDKALCVQFNLLLGRVAIVRIVGVPSHWRCRRLHAFGRNRKCQASEQEQRV